VQMKLSSQPHSLWVSICSQWLAVADGIESVTRDELDNSVEPVGLHQRHSAASESNADHAHSNGDTVKVST